MEYERGPVDAAERVFLFLYSLPPLTVHHSPLLFTIYKPLTAFASYCRVPRHPCLSQTVLPPRAFLALYVRAMSDSSELPWSDNPNAPQIPPSLHVSEQLNFIGDFIAAIFYGTVTHIVPAYPCLPCLPGV